MFGSPLSCRIVCRTADARNEGVWELRHDLHSKLLHKIRKTSGEPQVLYSQLLLSLEQIKLFQTSLDYSTISVWELFPIASLSRNEYNQSTETLITSVSSWLHFIRSSKTASSVGFWNAKCRKWAPVAASLCFFGLSIYMLMGLKSVSSAGFVLTLLQRNCGNAASKCSVHRKPAEVLLGWPGVGGFAHAHHFTAGRRSLSTSC